MTSVSYPSCNKQKQAIALLPTLSGKHRARHAFTLNPYGSYSNKKRIYQYKPYGTRIYVMKNNIICHRIRKGDSIECT